MNDMNFNPDGGLVEAMHIDASAQERAAQMQLLDSPSDMTFREWLQNVIEVATDVDYKVSATATGTLINGVPKLVLYDDGYGIAADDGGDPSVYTLRDFVTTIGKGGDNKDYSYTGNQNRGFRYAWASHSRMGVIIYSKQAGKSCYRTAFGHREGKFGMIEDIHVAVPPIDFGDHGTMFIILGNTMDANTVQLPFSGASDYAMGGLIPASMLSRRYWGFPDNLSVHIDAKTFRPDDKMKWGNTIKSLDEVAKNGNHHAEMTKVVTDEGIEIFYVDRRKGRFNSPTSEGGIRGTTSFGAADIGSFGALALDGEIFHFTERESWKSYAAHCGFGSVGDRISLTVNIPKGSLSVMSSFDRRTMKWQGYAERPLYKDTGDAVTLRSFYKDIVDHMPDWLATMIQNERNEIPDDDEEFKRKWRRRAEERKLQYLMPGDPEKGGREGRLIMPMPLVSPPGDNPPDPEPNGHQRGKWNPKSKNRVIGDIRPPEITFTPYGKDQDRQRFPVIYHVDYDDQTHAWDCTIDFNEDMRYYGMVFNAIVEARGRVLEAVLAQPPVTSGIKRLMMNAAKEVFGPHYMFAVFHANEINDPHAVIDWLGQDEVALQTMGHLDAWLELCVSKARPKGKSDEVAKAREIARRDDEEFLANLKAAS